MIHQKLYKRISFPILKTQEDFGLWLKIAKDGYKLYHIKKYYLIGEIHLIHCLQML